MNKTTFTCLNKSAVCTESDIVYEVTVIAPHSIWTTVLEKAVEELKDKSLSQEKWADALWEKLGCYIKIRGVHRSTNECCSEFVLETVRGAL